MVVMRSARQRALRTAGLAVLAATLATTLVPTAACAMPGCPMMTAGRASAPPAHCRTARVEAADCCAMAAPTPATTVGVSVATPAPTRPAIAALAAPIPSVGASQVPRRRPEPPGSSPPSGRERLALYRTLLI